MIERIQKALGKGVSTVGSLLKVALMSKSASSKAPVKEGRGIVIMGNGPSLRQTIDNDGEWLLSHDLMAVNFAALTSDFPRLRPGYYVLADGLFFSSATDNDAVRKLWKALERISWKMTLWVPSKMFHLAKPLVMNNHNITLKRFNLTPLEGYRPLVNMLIDVGLGMPRPRNVMIPAIMAAIREGYRKIWLCGADHTWTRTLSVDDENFVVSIQPHFYEDTPQEHERVRALYAGLHLHDVLGSMTIAFRSYWDVADFARTKGIEIINATPGSMIDAFPRK